ncbi:COPII subunit [Physocladia obscura]|uniref:COPII subunit n=1 Tax=Physocladia obscura TaxID=109957 RepID=A0AAD5SUS2_9FUNG|nr:COPII subunit [Physocladia obscura]
MNQSPLLSSHSQTAIGQGFTQQAGQQIQPLNSQNQQNPQGIQQNQPAIQKVQHPQQQRVAGFTQPQNPLIQSQLHIGSVGPGPANANVNPTILQQNQLQNQNQQPGLRESFFCPSKQHHFFHIDSILVCNSLAETEFAARPNNGNSTPHQNIIQNTTYRAGSNSPVPSLIPAIDAPASQASSFPPVTSPSFSLQSQQSNMSNSQSLPYIRQSNSLPRQQTTGVSPLNSQNVQSISASSTAGRRTYPQQPPRQFQNHQNHQNQQFKQQENNVQPGSQIQQPRIGQLPQQDFMQPAAIPQFKSVPRTPQFGSIQQQPVLFGTQQPSFGTPLQQQEQQQQQLGFNPPPPEFLQHPQPQQSVVQQSFGVSQLQNGMQNMNLASGNVVPQTQQTQAAVNLFQRVPQVSELETLTPPLKMSPQLSISQSPHAVCSPVYKRCTLNSIPQAQAVLNKTKIPFGLIVTPYRSLLPGEEAVPIVNSPQIIRCRRCRTYINPWVQFVEQGTRWKCNMCFLTNEVPAFFDWDSESRQQVDRMKRFELTHSVVEYIAPQEYIVHPPQPVVLLFIIDVSLAAVQSGMVDTISKGILKYLDKVPNSDGRTKVAFITVDNTLQFWNLSVRSSLLEPQMLVISDIEDAFLPLPEDLLVTLTESRLVVEKLLANLPNLSKATQNNQNCLGRALQVGLKLIGSIGGKIVIFQGSLANLSEGSLRLREDPKILGTPKEVTLLQPASPFYKAFAVECSRVQITIDLFAFNSQYLDLATLSGLTKVTGGSLYYYPYFNPANPQDIHKFETELQNFLSRPLALEAVLRIRASRGIRMTRFHGNFFLRSTDLLALPTVNPDYSYGIEMEIQDNLHIATVCFQTALLHTTSNGECRIRVLTLTVPVTDSLTDIYKGADQYAIAALLAKKGVEKCLLSNVEAARDELVSRLCDIIGSYKANFSNSGQNSMLMLPENLKLLPLLIMSVLKHVSFRTSGITPSDVRTNAQSLMCVYSCEAFMPNIQPRFWALHSMDVAAGSFDDQTSQPIFPPRLNLSSEKLERHGLYLLDNGVDIFLWVGRFISPELCSLIFGVPTYENIIPGKFGLPRVDNNWNKRVWNLIDYIERVRVLTMTMCPVFYVVKEDGDAGLRMAFLVNLVEDKLDSGNSYPLFLAHVLEKLNKPSGGLF